MSETYDNSKKEPIDVIWSNPTLTPGAQSVYCVPTCPSCDSPTYSEPACPRCLQPFTTEDGSVPKQSCPYCAITLREDDRKRGERLPSPKGGYIVELFGRHVLYLDNEIIGLIYYCPICGRELAT